MATRFCDRLFFIFIYNMPPKRNKTNENLYLGSVALLRLPYDIRYDLWCEVFIHNPFKFHSLKRVCKAFKKEIDDLVNYWFATPTLWDGNEKTMSHGEYLAIRFFQNEDVQLSVLFKFFTECHVDINILLSLTKEISPMYFKQESIFSMSLEPYYLQGERKWRLKLDPLDFLDASLLASGDPIQLMKAVFTKAKQQNLKIEYRVNAISIAKQHIDSCYGDGSFTITNQDEAAMFEERMKKDPFTIWFPDVGLDGNFLLSEILLSYEYPKESPIKTSINDDFFTFTWDNSSGTNTPFQGLPIFGDSCSLLYFYIKFYCFGHFSQPQALVWGSKFHYGQTLHETYKAIVTYNYCAALDGIRGLTDYLKRLNPLENYIDLNEFPDKISERVTDLRRVLENIQSHQ